MSLFKSLHPRAAGAARRAAAVAVVLLACAPAVLSAQTGGVRGTVTSRGEPLAGARVHLSGTSQVATTNPQGGFTLMAVRAGSQRIRVEATGFAADSAPVLVRPGAVTQLDLELAPSVIQLQGVTAIGSSAELREVRERMAQVPGSVHLVGPAEIRGTRQSNLSDVLRFVPGVYAQPRFGAADETQLSIRGSGLRNNFHLRGVNLLVNGMPYRNADGFTDFESLELLTTEDIQVYKGANALRYGGSTLGGAINLETKTGYTSTPLAGVAQGGSSGFFKGQLSSGAVLGRFNYYGSFARTELEGYREHGAQARNRVNLHLGYRLAENLDLRGFYLFARVHEELPGSLTAAEFAADPTAAVPNNISNDWGRDYDLHHVGVQLRAQLGAATRLEVAPYFQYRDIVHPIFRVIDQVSRDWGAELRLESTATLAGRANRFTLGAEPAYGNVDDRQYQNVGGESGALAKSQRDVAGGVAVYAEDALEIAPRLTSVLGVRWARDVRRVDDDFLSDGDQSDHRVFTALMPRLGLLYALPAVSGQLFANASRSYEPPLLLEVNSLTVPGFVDLAAQDAWQFEVGTRGRRAGVDWDVSLYDVEIRDEILNQNVQPFPNAPFTVPTYRNARRTRHYGVETGVGYTLPGSLLTSARGGDRLGVRLAHTFARYRFVDDSLFSGNQIPGAPEHVLQGELAYRHPSGLTLRPSVEWVPGSYFVDSGNTVRNQGWTVLSLRAEMLVQRFRSTVFVEGRNLTDARYAPAVQVDDAAGRFFNPADARSVYAGVRWQP